jgi:hypothetical protein
MPPTGNVRGPQRLRVGAAAQGSAGHGSPPCTQCMQKTRCKGRREVVKDLAVLPPLMAAAMLGVFAM